MPDLTVNEYQRQAATTAQYDGQNTMKGLLYTLMGLGAEAGETLNDSKKILRGDDLKDASAIGFGDNFGWCSEARRQKIISELGDVAWYLAMVSTELNIDLQSVLRRNLAKLANRAAEDNIKGEHES